MKYVRVYMFMDIAVEEESEIVDTVQRVIEEGTPHIGEGGIEITSHVIMDEEFTDGETEEPVSNSRHTSNVLTHITTEQMQNFCDTHSYTYVHTDDRQILRMRLIMSIRSYGVEDLLLDYYPAP